MILADTSVWIDHLRAGEADLSVALNHEQVLTHPFVVGELACGNLKNRARVLALLEKLPSTPVATDSEALAFIERRALMGRRIGYIDVHLLAATALAGGALLWTRHKRLAGIAVELALRLAGTTRP